MAWDVRGQLYKHGLAEKKLKILPPDGSICNLNRAAHALNQVQTEKSHPLLIVKKIRAL